MGDTYSMETDQHLTISPDIVPTRWWYWLGLLLGPSGILIIYNWTAVPWPTSAVVTPLESAAIVLTSGACALMLLKAIRKRELFYIMMAAFTVVANASRRLRSSRL